MTYHCKGKHRSGSKYWQPSGGFLLTGMAACPKTMIPIHKPF